MDTWLRIGKDGLVTVNFGKMDCGQGLDVAIAQFVADELDVAYDKVHVIMGDTRFTPNQGGGSGSTGLRMGSKPIRNAAAEARRVLLAAGAEHLGVPVSALGVENGRIFVLAEPAKSVTYAALIGGKDFSTPMKWNNTIGNTMDAVGQAKPKDPSQFKAVSYTHLTLPTILRV